ncbi:MAG TPA: 30S ribosomal protein S6 [Patescibacteria group bacterium]|nr:30S ribosomal protein S6 [Patescibacteria group bacterium]
MQEQSQHYELALIIPGSIAEDKHQEILTGVKNYLEQNQARLTQTTDWGRRKFAYAIKNLRHGFYFTLEFDLTPKILKELDKGLKLNNNLLRFMIVKKRIKTPEEIAREQKLKEKRAKFELDQRQAKVKEEAKGQKEKTSAKPKVSLEDLDKKLDELLEKDII